jgi:hypothetical protein
MQATQGQTTAMADLWAFFFLPCGLTPQITGSQKMQSEERAAQLLAVRVPGKGTGYPAPSPQIRT